jgi:hypothetical protein
MTGSNGSFKLTWQERARDTEKFHKDLLRKNEKHRIQDTADILHRSLGSISEDLCLASWLKTHPKVNDCKTIFDALRLVRKLKLEMRMR